MPESAVLIDDNDSYAVSVTNGWKSYQKNHVIRGLHMRVSKASIYALLGSSGCGKTTLLSCIVGLKVLDAGDVTVWGETPGTEKSGIPGTKVGYMPQDLSLYPKFTIMETFFLFGRFLNMKNSDIEERGMSYVKMLELPKGEQYVETLSGGQQRRVSLAIALFHNPDLVILDEPTVGVDPILRHVIWEHLTTLACEGKTIIISTHYIDEVKRADKVGFLRNGRIIVEKAPEDLLKQYDTSSLEDVFLSLSKEDGELPAIAESIPKITSISKKKSSQVLSKPSGPRWHILRTIIWKEYARLLRNMVYMVILLSCPLFSELITSSCLQYQQKSVTFGVVNNEFPSDPLCLPAKAEPDLNSSTLSCHYLDTVRKNIRWMNLQSYGTEEEAIESLHSGTSRGAFIIPANFTESLTNRLLDGRKSEDEILKNSDIFMHYDIADILLGAYLVSAIVNTTRQFTGSILEYYDFNWNSVNQPLEFETIYGSGDYVPTYRAVIGNIVLIPFCSVMYYTSLSYMEEKRLMMHDRLWVAGVKASHIFTGYLVVQYTLALVQSIVVVTLAVYIYSVPCNSALTWPIILLVLHSYCGTSLGFILGLLSNDEVVAILFIIGCLAINLFCGGTIWPIVFAQRYAQIFAKSLPCTLTTDSLRYMITLGWDIFHPLVWPGFAYCIGWMLVSTIIILGIVQIQKRRH